MSQRLFQFAVLYHPRPTKDQRDNGDEVRSELVVEPVTVMAKDEKVAGLLAAQAIPEKYKDRLDLVEILVRPF